MTRPELVAPVAGWPALVISLCLDDALPRRMAQLERLAESGHLPPARLVEVRRTVEAIRYAAQQWRTHADGGTTAPPAAAPTAGSTEVDTDTAAALLGVTPNRVRQLARRGDLVNARRAAGRWLIDRKDVELRKAATSERSQRG